MRCFRITFTYLEPDITFTCFFVLRCHGLLSKVGIHRGGVAFCCYNNWAPSTEMGHLAFRVGSLQQLAALKVNHREYGVWEVGS